MIGQKLDDHVIFAQLLVLDLLRVAEPAQEIGDILAVSALAPEVLEQPVDGGNELLVFRGRAAAGTPSPPSG